MSDVRQVRPLDSDSDEGPQTPKKKVKYDHKFQLKLLSDPKFSPWMIQSKTNPNKAFCTACDSELSGSITLLERHSLTENEKHKKNMIASNQRKKVTIFFQPSVSASFEKKQVVASELKMCAFIAEHNLPVSVMDHLPGFIVNVCQDSKIASAVKCGGTKASAILGNVMGDAFLSDLVVRLKDTKFSLIIDESTDLSTQKHLVLIARFYDLEVQKTCDHFLSLLQVTDCTAQGIFSSIVQFFSQAFNSYEKCYRLCQR
uniref:DUF4371 domain-containing protein n=1 Tax=Scylla olivacea TaxID=85551 RepID=A0A0P4WKD0_SCYOL